MVFMEVDDVENELKRIKKLKLKNNYIRYKLSEIHYNDWGNEFFMHDPSGVLWHIGEFRK